MPKQFTDKFLKSLPPESDPYYIREGRGFAIHVSKTGTKTFTYIYHLNGSRKYLKLGAYPTTSLAEARDKYQDAYRLVSNGQDPKEVKLAKPEIIQDEDQLTIGQLIETFVEHIANQKFSKSWKDDQTRFLQRVAGRIIGTRLLQDFRKRDALGFLDVIAKKGPAAARNAHRMMRVMFQYAEDRDYIYGNPFSKLTRAMPVMSIKPRSRVLSETEIRTVWNAIDKVQGKTMYKRALKLILVTAQRPGEVIGIHSDEMTTEASNLVWTLPEYRVKNKTAHRVFITSTAKELLGDFKGFAFRTIRQKDMAAKPNNLSELVSRANYFGLPRFTPHDLRRTARTHMERLGIPEPHAEAILNHKKGGMVKFYNLYEYDLEKKEALLKWEAELLRIIQGS